MVAHLLPHPHGLPIVTPDIAGAGQLEWHAGLGETPLPRLSGGCPPNYHLSLWAETADHPRAGAVAGVVAALLWVETAGHPGAGAVADVVAALPGVETTDSDSAPFSATSPAAASFVAAAFPAFVSLTALQRLQFDLQVQPAAAPGPGHLRQLARAAARL